ncbi:autotransporter-associated N-terminal domain-containing protein [Fusobacterium polymorphum]|uniref:autotransporter-associated N-terminal domain-containing protein n=1 Tax=Fusobacterium nucleatum subsp. polymorphum TaxID=76857 RepID=UPI002B4BBD86|nr:autotransporter-associated N-terminal domain-containing protein [Fusobacterium polymorphum]WRL75543.1 autotransporter-associated N-terminal domain-containing protein [Fusobacterium polymorphum]
MGNNNLYKVENTLRSIAKRYKSVKYSLGLAILFLMMGVSAFSEEVVAQEAVAQQEVMTNEQIASSKDNLKDSIGNLKSKIDTARTENEKGLAGLRLELIQLMEQGNQVVKSPWMSWQFGANYMYNKWNGTYKGKGDKAQKYPFEGVFVRETGANEFNRYVSENSSMYSYLSKSNNGASASSSLRGNTNDYGLASNTTVPENPVSFAISASIKPRIVTKGAITVPAPAALSPTLPRAIDFKPTTPKIEAPEINVSIPTLQNPPTTGNGDDAYILNGAMTQFLAGSGAYSPSGSDVGMIAQAHTNHIDNTKKAEMVVDVHGSSTDISTRNLIFTSAGGSYLNNNGWTYSTDLNETGYTGYAAMKITGGRKVNIDNTNITFSGIGTSYRKWLFHIDGHNSGASGSAWIIGSGSKIDITGKALAMYTAQYHGNSNRSNIGFINNGIINSTGADNYIFYTMSAGGSLNRQFYIQNNGSINLSGNGNVLAVINGENIAGGGFSFENSASGSIELSGNNQVGAMIMKDYPVGEILLNSAIKISGKDSVGVVFPGSSWLSLEGGVAFAAGNTTEALNLPTTSRNSVFKLDLSGEKNTGIYFNSTTTNKFKPIEYKITSTNGKKNTLIAIANGEVELDDSKTHELNITKGSGSTAIYTSAAKALTTKATIDISDSDGSVGLFAEKLTNDATVTNSGTISASGKSVKAIVSKGRTITSTGKIIVNGTALSDTDGAVGLASMNGGNLTQNNANTNITVDGSASIGAYADGKVGVPAPVATTLTMTGGTITAKGGAFNTYAANSGTITLNGVTLNTEKKSLAFYTTDNGKIDFGTGATTTANIKGGTDSNSRGTAFLYKGTGATYAPFTPNDVKIWAGANFAHLDKLKLNMEQGSRLFIAQNVAMDLSGTAPGGIAGALPGVTFTGSNDYKTFMLYLSKLKLDQNINLEDPTDAYNKLEVSNSSIENNNSNTITGTSDGRVAIAQENDTTIVRDKVKLINSGNINLSGANSTGIYGKFAEIINETTGTMNVGATSAAIYGTTDSKLENKGTMNLGANSVGIFSKGDTAAGYVIGGNTYKGSVSNSGTIASTGKAIGVTYNGTGAGVTDTRITNDTTGKINLVGEGSVGIYGLGSNYNILNKGEITLGNSSNISTSPNVGVYTAVETVSIKNDGTGKITAGNNSVGAYGYDIENGGNVTVGDNGVAIYSKRKAGGPSTVTNTGNVTVGANNATALFLENGGNLNLNAGTLNVGAGSYGVVAIGNDSFTYNNNAAVNVNLGNGSTYFYSNNPTTNFTNNVALNTTSKGVYGISTVGTVTNSANFTLGDESVGVLYNGTGTAKNTANIRVGNSDVENENYAIGMATKTGTIENDSTGTITVGSSGIGLFADGANSKAINRGTINLNGDKAMGMYLDNGAQGVNYGTIRANGTAKEAVGVVVQHHAKFINETTGVVDINSEDGYAFFKATGGTIVNKGTINLGGGAKETYDPTSKPTSKTTGSVKINAPSGATPATTTITVAGVPQTIQQVLINTPQGKTGPAPTSLGIYVDTLGGTNPINGNLGLVTTEADLILGNEVAKTTTSKNIIVSGAILDPYNAMMAANSGVTWNAYAGALTWTATPLYKDGLLGSVVLAKIPYTEFAGNTATPVDKTDTYNFLDGLEQRYGVDPVGSREKQLFDKLNEIGKNEKVLFFQATDEMMGHQYANVQQRINATGNILDKEFDYLRGEWQTASKDSNKIKTFGTRGDYKTDTAGIIDYKYNAYGVAYVHENEDIKLGRGIGWYAGIVHNRIKFKDIGGSKEDQLQGKVGLYKSVPFDDNNSLNWTISGDIFVGRNRMHRRFLVVDEVFHAKSRYYNYGISIKNEIGKEFRLSESFTLRPYAALDLEYGRISKIREKSGEIKLEVKQNHYISVKPEIGAELAFKQYFGRKTLKVGLGVAYENELGRVAKGKNKARVADTTADWFNIRSEKEDRRGNVKFDLNLGLDNQRFGVTGNVGYDTKGQNVRGGLGLRVIF